MADEYEAVDRIVETLRAALDRFRRRPSDEKAGLFFYHAKSVNDLIDTLERIIAAHEGTETDG